MDQRSLKDSVQLYVNFGDTVEVTVNGEKIAGEVKDINEHFLMINQKEGSYLLFWKAIDAVWKWKPPIRDQ